ncbi:MAG: hypothetical protein Q4G25_07040 [Paracoccus sp. (in: a-proteobacteria)]|nr:hypothetical protein [Paracoccus sp. (in: a-proteobacteria)]
MSVPFAWAITRAEAEAAIEDPEYDAWLNDLRPSAYDYADIPAADKAMINTALSDMATMLREAIEPDLQRIKPREFTDEQQGFGPSAVVGLFRWVAITYAQQRYLNDHLGKKDPILADELFAVFEAGHLPVGWRQTALSGTLLVW